MSTPVRRIGLIGAIAAGKSRVAGRFRELGARVVDGDLVGHRVLARPEITARVAQVFGDRVIDASGEVDRRKLAPLVFGNPELRLRLEEILHPEMRVVFEKELTEAEMDPNAPIVVFDAAVLLEKGWDDLVDAIVFVDADADLRFRRTLTRGWPSDELERREAAQWPTEKKRRRADHILVCDDWNDCCMQVDELFQKWTAANTRLSP